MMTALTMLAEAGTAAGGDQSAWIAAGFILLAAGLVLGVLEIFVPTGGLLAAATAICFVASIVMFFLHQIQLSQDRLVLETKRKVDEALIRHLRER